MANTLPATLDPLAGHTVMRMLDVAMSSIIGDDADLEPEWQWVKQMASHEDVSVRDESAYEFTLNLAMVMALDALPPALQPLLTAAQQAGVNYILFYNG